MFWDSITYHIHNILFGWSWFLILNLRKENNISLIKQLQNISEVAMNHCLMDYDQSISPSDKTIVRLTRSSWRSAMSTVEAVPRSEKSEMSDTGLVMSRFWWLRSETWPVWWSSSSGRYKWPVAAALDKALVWDLVKDNNDEKEEEHEESSLRIIGRKGGVLFIATWSWRQQRRGHSGRPLCC